MTTKMDIVLDTIERAMIDDNNEFGVFDMENNVTAVLRPVTRDGFRTIIVNAGAYSCTVTYHANRQNNDMFVHARTDVVTAIMNECQTYATGWNVVRV